MKRVALLLLIAAMPIAARSQNNLEAYLKCKDASVQALIKKAADDPNPKSSLEKLNQAEKLANGD
ncbi:MAG TPA: hypothetical protein VK171_08595, partial [Fimbriimonas sp.]|nr:hypothetical protein [Fimbriimonas sp.]